MCASVALARGSWREKPATQWSQKDIRQILDHSPWGHRVSVVLRITAIQAESCPGTSGPCERADSFRDPSTSNTVNGIPTQQALGPRGATWHAGLQELQQRSSGPGSPEGSTAADAVSGVSVVRWVSAQTMRDALAKMVSPSGKRMDPQELAQLAGRGLYVLYVDLRVPLADVSRIPQNGVLTPRLVRRSVLVLKSSGLRIPAVRIASAPLPEFDDRKQLSLAAYYIFFPKEKDGHAVFSAGQREVRFECPLAPEPIHAEFKLSQMEREGSPDL